MMVDANSENDLHEKPCLFNKEVRCVQYPLNKSDDDGCDECEIRLKALPIGGV